MGGCEEVQGAGGGTMSKGDVTLLGLNLSWCRRAEAHPGAADV